ncbi:PASTA domain-containing protein [Amycolatopsis sp. WQ 127309]|uniref:PASTA domain-containing protein n=1 Tax=Amycolatopsis sp. WQ 127309 TaxID=2932773 RepID=UPI001FF49F19|nr:PASTA domain-containing protein [Amycolatopsis sp. WQ 127309]UOZ02614.1 PASTA domain-containing protein [Amycolatopsis sp. WQ 127309]
MSRPLTAAFVVLALGLTACGVPPGDPGRTTTPSTPAAPTSAKLIKVPDVSGMNHQDAQNAMQKAGLYNLREVDGTGQGRALLIDRNWVQTGQDPAPGTEVQPDAVITLTAVKTTER